MCICDFSYKQRLLSIPISRTVNLSIKVIQRIEKAVFKNVKFIDYAFVLTNSLFIKSDFCRANFIFGINCLSADLGSDHYGGGRRYVP